MGFFRMGILGLGFGWGLTHSTFPLEAFVSLSEIRFGDTELIGCIARRYFFGSNGFVTLPDSRGHPNGSNAEQVIRNQTLFVAYSEHSPPE